MSLLKITDLCAGYGQTPVLHDINLDVGQEEIVGIVGESGSGKSTLFNTVTRLEPDLNITCGNISFRGRDLDEVLKEEGPSFYAKNIGVAFQNSTYSLVPTRRVSSQFEEAVNIKNKVPKEQIRKKALDLFDFFSLRDPAQVYDSYPFELSGGMSQRVALALAIIQDPVLLLCDEPTSALDVQVEVEIVQELKALRDKKGISILIITHNMHLASYLCDRIYVLYKGKIVEYGRSREVLEDPRHPYTQNLIASIPDFLGDIPHSEDGQKLESGPGGKYDTLEDQEGHVYHAWLS